MTPRVGSGLLHGFACLLPRSRPHRGDGKRCPSCVGALRWAARRFIFKICVLLFWINSFSLTGSGVCLTAASAHQSSISTPTGPHYPPRASVGLCFCKFEYTVRFLYAKPACNQPPFAALALRMNWLKNIPGVDTDVLATRSPRLL